MKVWYRKLSLPLAVLTIVAMSGVVSRAADQAADGQKLSPNVTGGTGAEYSARPAVPVLTGGMYDTDSTSRIFRTTTEGWQITSEGNKDRDLWLNEVAINDTTYLFHADSTSSAIYTAPYGRLFLHIKLANGGGALATTNVGLAVRLTGGYSAVSDTTVFQPFFTPRGIFAAVDTTVSTRYGGFAAATDIVLGPGEFLVTIPFNATKWGSTSGAYVELVDRFGLPYWAPYTNIRIRLVSSSVAASFYRVTARLIGRPF